MINLQLTEDMVPRPVQHYAELWGREAKTISAWCQKGQIPGAFIGPNGHWWISPLALIVGTFDPARLPKEEGDAVKPL